MKETSKEKDISITPTVIKTPNKGYANRYIGLKIKVSIKKLLTLFKKNV
jgi:hypothetical protein